MVSDSFRCILWDSQELDRILPSRFHDVGYYSPFDAGRIVYISLGGLIMKTEEIVKLTPRRVAALIRARRKHDGGLLHDGNRHERRCQVRWPSPGTVEIWPADGDGRERLYGTCHTLSQEGIGMVSDQPFAKGTKIELACHFQEVSLYGRGIVRHCTGIPDGFLVGVQFEYDTTDV